MTQYEKAAQVKSEWEQEKLEQNDFLDMSQLELIREIREEIQKDMDRIVLNVLNSKSVKVDGKAILERIKERMFNK
jgi:hypothetical protein